MQSQRVRAAALLVVLHVGVSAMSLPLMRACCEHPSVSNSVLVDRPEVRPPASVGITGPPAATRLQALHLPDPSMSLLWAILCCRKRILTRCAVYRAVPLQVLHLHKSNPSMSLLLALKEALERDLTFKCVRREHRRARCCRRCTCRTPA